MDKIFCLNCVEPGIEGVVLLHEVVKGPDLDHVAGQVALVPAQLPALLQGVVIDSSVADTFS